MIYVYFGESVPSLCFIWQPVRAIAVTHLHRYYRVYFIFSDNGPCLGSRTGPNLEYQWM